jgi:hypothetical protein
MLTVAFSRTVHTKLIVCFATATMVSQRHHNITLHVNCFSSSEIRFRLSAKRTSPFKSAGASVQSTTGSRGVLITGSNAGYIMFRGSVKSNGYTPHSPVSPSRPLPCVTVFHHISTGLYNIPRCTYFGINLEDVYLWHDLTGH